MAFIEMDFASGGGSSTNYKTVDIGYFNTNGSNDVSSYVMYEGTNNVWSFNTDIYAYDHPYIKATRNGSSTIFSAVQGCRVMVIDGNTVTVKDYNANDTIHTFLYYEGVSKIVNIQAMIEV